MRLDSYKQMLGHHGTTRRERDLNSLKNRISRNVGDSLSSSRVTINGEEQDVAIISTNENESKKILSLPGETFHLGAIVWWMSAPWMIVSLDMQDEVYTSAIMTLCNYLLKWKNSKGEIVERWCILEDKNNSGSSGIEDNDRVTLGDARIQVLLAKDEETRQLHRDQRFLIDDEDVTGKGDVVAYEVTKIYRAGNLYRGEGTYRYILEECVRTARDNTELLIADYYDEDYIPSDIPVGNENYSFRIDTDYTATVNTNIDIPISVINNATGESVECEYTYDIDDKTGAVSVLSALNEKLILKIKDKHDAIGKTFKITLAVPELNLEDTLEMQIVGWF